MEYAYVRVSTDKQETDNQLHHINRLYPNALIVSETGSGVKDKPVLNALIASLSPGDVLITVALDRLGRTLWKAVKLLEELSSQGIKVISLRENIDFTTPAGKMMAGVMLSLAQMERDLISERTKMALQAKIAAGVKVGRAGWKTRPGRISESVRSKIKDLRNMGTTLQSISNQTGVSIGSVYAITKEENL